MGKDGECYDGVAVWENRADFRHGYVNAHNAYRVRVGLPPMAASMELERNVQDHVQGLYDHHCSFEAVADARAGEPPKLRYTGCPEPDGCQYGENGWSRADCVGGRESSYMYANWTGIVDAWWSQLEHYWYGPVGNGCTQDKHQVTGEFTQLAWEHTRFVGCAQVFCKGAKKVLAFCHYGPPGNILGHRPYSFKVAQRIQKAFHRGTMLQNPRYPECDPQAAAGKVFDLVRWRFLGARRADRKLRRFYDRSSSSSGIRRLRTTYKPSSTSLSDASKHAATQHHKAPAAAAVLGPEGADGVGPTMYDESLQLEKAKAKAIPRKR